MYDVDAIRRACRIEEIAARSGIALRAVGNRLVGRCPFHRDTRPSLVVYRQSASFYCFGCGAGGDVLDFVGRLQGISFKETLTLLAGNGELKPTAHERGKVLRLVDWTESSLPSRRDLAVIDIATSFYHEALWQNDNALAYLARRGIEEKTARRFRLGFGRPGLAAHLRHCGLDLQAAQRAGLLAGERDLLLQRIAVSDLGPEGSARWLTARAIDERAPRYLNLRLRKPLLGLAQVEGDQVIVAEGPFDWLTLAQWGMPAVALLGTHLSRDALRALSRFRRVYLALDVDEAGRNATQRLRAALGARAIPIGLPSGIHDLNELGCLPEGREIFQLCLKQAVKEEASCRSRRAMRPARAA